FAHRGREGRGQRESRTTTQRRTTARPLHTARRGRALSHVSVKRPVRTARTPPKRSPNSQAVTRNGRSISVSARPVRRRSVASARTPDRLSLGEIHGASRLGPTEHRHLGAERFAYLRLLPGRFAQFRGGPGSGPQSDDVHAGP